MIILNNMFQEWPENPIGSPYAYLMIAGALTPKESRVLYDGHGVVNLTYGHVHLRIWRTSGPCPDVVNFPVMNGKSVEDWLSLMSVRHRDFDVVRRGLIDLDRTLRGTKGISLDRKVGLARFYRLSRRPEWVRLSMHNVLGKVSSPGLGPNLRAKPWLIDLRALGKRVKPAPRMRVWIPKPDGGLRPLAVPTMSDRIRERAILTIMEVVAAGMQSSNSIGFRYNQDRHRGLSRFLSRAMVKYGTDGFNLLDTDFRKYFDSIPHAGLKAILLNLGMEEGSREYKFVIRSIKAPILYSGHQDSELSSRGMSCPRDVKPEVGTPQGSLLSPLLSNLYGAHMDIHLETLGLMHVRYADNLLVAYPSSWSLEDALKRVKEGLPEGIQLHEGKTSGLEGNGTLFTLGCKITRTPEGIDFSCCEGYDSPNAKPGPLEIHREVFGGLNFIRQALGWVRNLAVHQRHQPFIDRRTWARRVGNARKYLDFRNSFMVRPGVYREVKILPGYTSQSLRYRMSWDTIRMWLDGGRKTLGGGPSGLVRISINEIIREQELSIQKAMERLRSALHQDIRLFHRGIPPGVLHFEGDPYRYYDLVSRLPIRCKHKSPRYYNELRSRVVFGNLGMEGDYHEFVNFPSSFVRGMNSHVYLGGPRIYGLMRPYNL